MPALKTILVIEDEKPLLEMYVLALKKRGYQTEKATTGEEGLEKLKQNPRINLILLDLILPEINGIDVLRQIRSEASPFNNIPVYVLTNVDNKQTIQEAVALGVRGYFLKVDLTPKKLADEIDHFFSTSPFNS